MTRSPYRVGDFVTVYGVTCRIVRVWPLGTLDVETLDGSRAWRVTGLHVR